MAPANAFCASQISSGTRPSEAGASVWAHVCVATSSLGVLVWRSRITCAESTADGASAVCHSSDVIAVQEVKLHAIMLHVVFSKGR